MTGLEPAIPRSEVWCLIHQATWSHLMNRSVLNDNFNRKHGEILDTAQGLEDSICFIPRKMLADDIASYFFSQKQGLHSHLSHPLSNQLRPPRALCRPLSFYFHLFQFVSICLNTFQSVSICFNLFEYVPIMSDDVINSKHGEIEVRCVLKV